DRRAHRGVGTRVRHRGQAAARDPGRDLAGQLGRALQAPLGPLAGAPRSQLQRSRALRHRRRGPLPVHDDQAGALPVGQPLQRLAAGAHPLLAARARLHPAPGDPDVLPGRPVLPVRPDLQLGPRSEGARAHGLELLDPRHRAELGPRLRVRYLPPGAGVDAVRGGALIFETTPSQTVGPYFAIGLPFDVGPFVVPEGTPGAIHISGTIYDGAGEPIPDFLLETWQADSEGPCADVHGHGGPSQLDGFRGFARYGLEDGDGSFDLVTVKPGPVPGLAGTIQAPHIDVSVFARGMLHRSVTRIYFAD